MFSLKLPLEKLAIQLSQFGLIYILISSGSTTLAQVSPDATLSTEIKTANNSDFFVTGGTTAKTNLFHSFNSLSIPNNGSLTYLNPASIQNVISRVTGKSISNINGLVKAQGNANLILINPNGISFGPNSSINIGGSLLFSTANSLLFEDGTIFSSLTDQKNGKSTSSSLIALRFGRETGKITNESRSGIQVNTGKSLALLGGNLEIRGGKLLAPSGKILLGAVGPNNTVGIDFSLDDLNINFDNVDTFSDIFISSVPESADNINRSTISVTNIGPRGQGASGSIESASKRIFVSGGSQFLALNAGMNKGGDISINASEGVFLSGGAKSQGIFFSSGFFANTISGDSGDIRIETKALEIDNGASITTNSFSPSFGKSGNIDVSASDYIKISGVSNVERSTPSGLSTLSQVTGASGDLNITTSSLNIVNGGLISASTAGSGTGGRVTVKSKNVRLSGTSPNNEFSSSIRSTSLSSGSAGKLNVSADNLIILEGAAITTSTFGSGDAGSIKLSVVNEIYLRGQDSGIFANASLDSSGAGGSINIDPKVVTILNGAAIGVNSDGSGPGGNIDLVSGKLILSNQGLISASSATNQGGNITLKLDDFLLMRGQSTISASSGNNSNPGSGGNISISADYVVAEPNSNSDITANSFSDLGGKIKITARRSLFGFKSRTLADLQRLKPNIPNPQPSDLPSNDVTAFSQTGGADFDGQITIDSPNVDPSENLSDQPEVVERPQEIAEGCRPGQSLGNSTFIHVGRGGLPSSPNGTQTPTTVWRDLRAHYLQPSYANSTDTLPMSLTSRVGPDIVEAKGWSKDSQGRIYLTANVPQPTQSPQPIATC